MKIEHMGFTLIELLVVISIIALLASVVLSSLNSARTKAADNAVKAALKQVLIEAENYRDDQTSFYPGGTGPVNNNCTIGVFSNLRITNQLGYINTNSGSTASCAIDSTLTKWSVFVPSLKGGDAWCIDNTGWFKAATAGTDGSCS